MEGILSRCGSESPGQAPFAAEGRGEDSSFLLFFSGCIQFLWIIALEQAEVLERRSRLFQSLEGLRPDLRFMVLDLFLKSLALLIFFFYFDPQEHKSSVS